MAGVVIFRGLAGNSGANGASVTIKTYQGQEVIPRAFADQRIYATDPCVFSPRALEAYFAIARRLNDAYPASYNLFGTLGSVIARAAAYVWPILKQVAVSTAARAIAPKADTTTRDKSAPVRQRATVVRQAKTKRTPKVPRALRNNTRNFPPLN